MAEVIAERYSPNEWNIYGAQASDGDNWNDDSPLCVDVLKKGILPHVQYFSYVEITRRMIEDFGYYFALNDYVDAEVSMDWRSGARPCGNWMGVSGHSIAAGPTGCCDCWRISKR